MKSFTVILFACLLISGCTLLTEPAAQTYDASAVIKRTTRLIKDHYPFLAFKNIKIDSLGEWYAQKIPDYPGDALFTLLHDYLYELKDGHVWFYGGGGFRIQPYVPPRMDKDRFAYNPETTRRYFAQKLTLTAKERIEYGMSEDSVSYIYLATFIRDDGRWIDAFAGIIKELQNTAGLILDVRHNGGGSDYITAKIIGFFIQTAFPGPMWVNARGDTLPGYVIPPNGQIYYARPVVVLQNGMCFSAAEGFINVMRELPQVTTLGDTTAGGSGAPEDFYAGENITIHLPTKAELTYDGQYIEWNGLPPDILIPQSRTDVENGRDIQLEKAFEILKSQTGKR